MTNKTSKGSVKMSLTGKYLELQGVLYALGISRETVAACIGGSELDLANKFYGNDELTVKEAQDITALLKDKGVTPAEGSNFSDLFFSDTALLFYVDGVFY